METATVSDPMNWLAAQIGARQEPPRPQHANPRPAGVIRPGSGTDVLLRFLRMHPLRWFFHPELVLALGRSRGEVDWALGYLVREGLAESRVTELPARKPVLRYRVMQPQRGIVKACSIAAERGD